MGRKEESYERRMSPWSKLLTSAPAFESKETHFPFS